MSTRRMNASEFAAEVERLLWTFQDPTPDLAENLGLIETLLEDYDASTRAHLALAEALLKGTVWADHQELSQNLLWALYTLHDQGSLRLGMSFPDGFWRKAVTDMNRAAGDTATSAEDGDAPD